MYVDAYIKIAESLLSTPSMHASWVFSIFFYFTASSSYYFHFIFLITRYMHASTDVLLPGEGNKNAARVNIISYLCWNRYISLYHVIHERVGVNNSYIFLSDPFTLATKGYIVWKETIWLLLTNTGFTLKPIKEANMSASNPNSCREVQENKLNLSRERRSHLSHSKATSEWGNS